jgi:hypothetical protein
MDGLNDTQRAVLRPQPSNYQDIGTKTKAATLAVYAEQDTRITGSAPQMEEQLKKAGVPYQIWCSRA